MNLTRVFWVIIALIMAAALEIDWRSKTEEAFKEVSVKICRLGLPSHPLVAPPTLLPRRSGRCPVVDCSRLLLPGKRVRFEVVHPVSGLAQVWICPGCRLTITRHAHVRVERITHRLSIKRYITAMLEAFVSLVCLMCVGCRSRCDTPTH